MLETIKTDGAFIIGDSQDLAIRGELCLGDFAQVAFQGGEVHEDGLSVHMHDSQGVVLPLGVADQEFSCGVEHERVHLGGHVAEFFEQAVF